MMNSSRDRWLKPVKVDQPLRIISNSIAWDLKITNNYKISSNNYPGVDQALCSDITAFSDEFLSMKQRSICVQHESFKKYHNLLNINWNVNI